MGGFDSFRERCGLIFMMRVMELPLWKGDKVWRKVSRKWKLVAGKSVRSDVQIAEPYHLVEHYGKLAKEKEVVGIYISGHPLDDYKFEMKYL
jgi:DNA polymerase III alpha subunit